MLPRLSSTPGAPFASGSARASVFHSGVCAGIQYKLARAFKSQRGPRRHRACTALAGNPNGLFFKKVDSAGRGPLAAELLAAHRALGTRAILFAPAFPATGRTVSDGVLEIEDASGKHSRVQLNSLFPIMARSHIFQISHARELAPALDSDSAKTIFICDSATQADLNALAKAAKDFPACSTPAQPDWHRRSPGSFLRAQWKRSCRRQSARCSLLERRIPSPNFSSRSSVPAIR